METEVRIMRKERQRAVRQRGFTIRDATSIIMSTGLIIQPRVAMEVLEMPVNYVVEMFCDRVAASKIYNKDKYKDSDSLEYFKRGMNHYIMHPKTKELIYSLLTMLAEKGEDYTFAYIKENVLK